MSRFRSFALLSLFAASGLLIAAVSPLVPIGKKTHLNAPVSAIVNAATLDPIPNDNSSGHEFTYDRGAAFKVPKGYSFVVTDIHLTANAGQFATSDKYLVVFDFGPGGSRTFSAQYAGVGDKTYSFSGGMVIPGGTTPTVRNTTFSTHAVLAQMFGYFVDDDALPENESAFGPSGD